MLYIHTKQLPFTEDVPYLVWSCVQLLAMTGKHGHKMVSPTHSHSETFLVSATSLALGIETTRCVYGTLTIKEIELCFAIGEKVSVKLHLS